MNREIKKTSTVTLGTAVPREELAHSAEIEALLITRRQGLSEGQWVAALGDGRIGPIELLLEDEAVIDVGSGTDVDLQVFPKSLLYSSDLVQAIYLRDLSRRGEQMAPLVAFNFAPPPNARDRFNDDFQNCQTFETNGALVRINREQKLYAVAFNDGSYRFGSLPEERLTIGTCSIRGYAA